MFNNLTLYRIGPQWVPTLTLCEEQLAKQRFEPCAPSQEKSRGWVPPRGEKNGPLVEAVHGQWMLLLEVETKTVPADLVKRKLDERAEQIEETTGRKPGKRERKELKEAIIAELMPMAFPKRKQIPVWIDRERMQLAVAVSSSTQSDGVVTDLVRAFEDFAVHAFTTQREPTQSMSAWLLEHEAPQLDIGRSAELRAPGEGGASVRYEKHSLDIPAIRDCINEGMFVTQLHFIWEDTVSFALNEDFTLRKVTFLDAKDASEAEAFDTNVVLETGSLNQLIDTLVDILGGIQPLVDPRQTSIADVGGDELYAQAVAVVMEHGKPSISLVQRYLKIGYNRAASLLEKMEANGVVSAMDPKGVRTILKAGS